VEISFTAGCCSLSPGFGRGETGGGNWRKLGKLDTHLLREGPGAPTSGRTWRTWKRAGEGGHPPPTYFGKELENLEKRGRWREGGGKVDTHLLREGAGEPGKEPGKLDTHLLREEAGEPGKRGHLLTSGLMFAHGGSLILRNWFWLVDFQVPSIMVSFRFPPLCLLGVQDFQATRIFGHPPLCLVGVQDLPAWWVSKIFLPGGCPRFLFGWVSKISFQDFFHCRVNRLLLQRIKAYG